MNEYDNLIGNEYDVLLDEMESGQRTDMRTAMKSAVKTTPERQAEVISLADKSKLPTDIVDRNLDTVRNQVQQNEYDDLIKQSPDLAEWLSSPENAAVARDDIFTLSAIEKSLKVAGVPQVSGIPALTVPMSTRQTEDLMGGVGNVARGFSAGVIDTPGMTFRGLGETYGVAGRAVDRLLTVSLEAAGLDDVAKFFAETRLPWWADPYQILRGSGETFGKAAKAVDVPQGQETIASDIGKGLGQLSAQITAAILSGGASNSANLAMLFGQGVDQQRGLKEEYGPAESTPASDAALLAGGVITTITEKFGLDKILDRVAPKIKNSVLRYLADISIAGGIEATQETVEGVIQRLTAAATYEKEVPIIEGVDREAVAAGGTGAIARGLLNLITPGRPGGPDKVAQSRQAEQTLDQIAQAAQNSKLAQRSPDKFKQYVQQVGEKEGLEAIYIPVEELTTYFQSQNIDPGAEVSKLTGDPSAYEQAIATGSDIKVPIQNFAADMAVHYEGLKPHIRTSPEALTPTEAKEFESRQEEFASQFTEETDSSQQVYESILGQLINAGIDKKAAQKQATLYRSVFRSLGERTGIDSVELYNRYGLSVSREDLPAVERRKDTEQRAEIQGLRDRVAQMREKVASGQADPVELENLITELSDTAFKYPVTGLPNRLAYEETKGTADPAAQTQGEGIFHISGDEFQVLAGGKEISVDADSLKWVNDNMSPAMGDMLLKEVGQAVQQTFNPQDPVTGLAEAQKILDGAILEIQKPDGEIIELRGVRITHGNPANTKDEADFSLKAEKKRREQEGLRAGREQEPPNVRRRNRPEPDTQGFEAAQDQVRSLDQSPKTPSDEGVSVSARQKITQTPAFKKWFGDSAVVNENGEPLVVYHGTDADFTEFKNDPDNRRFPYSFGLHFTDSPGEASVYADSVENAATGFNPSSRFAQEPAAGGNVMPVYLKVENPLVIEGTFQNQAASMEADLNRGEIIRKLVEARKAGKPYDGVIIRRKAGDEWDGMNIIVFDPKQIKSATGNRGTFDPDSPNILLQPPPPLDGIPDARGRIRFNEGHTQFNIQLLKNADLSTFLHESGHFYLEVLGDLHRRGEGTQLKADFQSILDWLGVKSFDEITVDQHEQFARGFEAYLMEGNAPSTELQGVFARFRSWLTKIYRTIKSLDVELTDEVRRVFDRLVATEDEIAIAREEQQYSLLFATAEDAGMTEAEFQSYRKTAEEAREAAETKLANQAIKEITRERRKWWKEERVKVRKEIEADVNHRPVYKAITYFSKGTLPDGSPLPEGATHEKLSKQSLLRLYDNTYIVRHLFPKKVYTNDGGVDPDVMAPVFGFGSGDQMVKAIAHSESRLDVIEQETDARMKELHGDMLDDGSIRQKAMEAVHNEKQEQLLLAELRAIRRKQGDVKPFLRQADQARTQARKEGQALLPTQKELRFIKASAEQMIGQKKIRDINPNLYRVAEQKAARTAFNAAAKGDFDAAYNAKLQQIRSHALYRAAAKAKNDSESIVKYLRKFRKKSLRSKLGKVDRLEQVDMLLDRYDLRRVSNKQINAENAKFELLSQIRSGLLVAPKSFTDSLKTDGKINYRDETIESFRGLKDILKQIETEARNEFEVMVNDERMVLNDIADQMADTVLTTNKSVMPAYGSLSPEEKMKEFGKSLLNAWLRTPALARLLDGDQRGSWTKFIIEPIRKAVVEKLEPMKAKAQEDLAKLYSDHYSQKEMVRNGDRFFVPGINLSLSKWDLISLALNWGNAENRKAVLESTVAGRQPFTEQGVMQALSTLDARDWDFVQSVWGYVDSYWPQIKEAQRRRKGISPPKVEADPFTIITKDGQTKTLEGGYYPLKYNPRLDAKSRQHEIDDAFERMRVGTLSSTQTKYGHVQERVGSGGQPVMLSLNVLHSHINNVIMDISLGDAVGYVDKVLRQPQVKQSLIDTGNLDALESFKLWLKDVAVGEMAARAPGEQVARFVRLGFTKSKIGFNLVTAALQVAGVPQTMVVTGTKNFAVGTKEYAKNPRQAIQQVMSQSSLMKTRYELNAYNKDIQGVYEALKAGHTATASNPFVRNMVAILRATQIPGFMVNAAFYLMKNSQLQVDTITWLAGYEGGKNKGLNHDESVLYADSIVENAQTSGMWNDRSPIERGTFSRETRQSEYVKLLTTLGSYMIAKGNIAFESYKSTDFKNLGSTLSFGMDIIALFSVEAIMAAAIRGQWPEDDEDWWAWTAAETVKSAASTIPLVREIPSAIRGFSVGGPLGSFVSDIGRAWNQAAQGEMDAAFLKAWSNLIGTLTGYPSAQINRFIDASWRESEGEDVAPIEYVVGRRY